jgi:hypothetical protein
VYKKIMKRIKFVSAAQHAKEKGCVWLPAITSCT